MRQSRRADRKQPSGRSTLEETTRQRPAAVRPEAEHGPDGGQAVADVGWHRRGRRRRKVPGLDRDLRDPLLNATAWAMTWVSNTKSSEFRMNGIVSRQRRENAR